MKVTGPMMSLDASGTIAGTITAAKWKGRNYMRQTVKPSNPKSAGQTATRAMFKFLGQIWATMATQQKTSWEELASATNITAFNAFVQYNMAEWTQDVAPIADYNEDTPEVPEEINNFAATAGVKQITLSGDNNSMAPDDWGWVIYRSETNNFTPTHSDVVAVRPTASAQALSFVDTGLKSGTTYYYKAALINYTGTTGALTAQASATPN